MNTDSSKNTSTDSSTSISTYTSSSKSTDTSSSTRTDVLSRQALTHHLVQAQPPLQLLALTYPQIQALIYHQVQACCRSSKKINGKIKYESYLRKKDDLPPRFNIFEVAEILNFENMIRESLRYKYYNCAIRAFGNVWKIHDFDKIVSLSLHCSGRCWDDKTVKDYFDCCILFKEFLGLNIYHIDRKGSFWIQKKNWPVGKLSVLPQLTVFSFRKYVEVKDALNILVTEMWKQDDWCKFSEK